MWIKKVVFCVDAANLFFSLKLISYDSNDFFYGTAFTGIVLRTRGWKRVAL